MSSLTAEWVIFGNIAIVRLFCPECRASSFVRDGDFVCCGGDATLLYGRELRKKRESDAVFIRKRPPPRDRRQILDEQNQRCFWCSHRFGATVEDSAMKQLVLEVTWDHVIPHVYSRDNRTSNFVATCQICNRYKSAKVGDLELVRLSILASWAGDGWREIE